MLDPAIFCRLFSSPLIASCKALLNRSSSLPQTSFLTIPQTFTTDLNIPSLLYYLYCLILACLTTLYTCSSICLKTSTCDVRMYPCLNILIANQSSAAANCHELFSLRKVTAALRFSNFFAIPRLQCNFYNEACNFLLLSATYTKLHALHNSYAVALYI